MKLDFLYKLLVSSIICQYFYCVVINIIMLIVREDTKREEKKIWSEDMPDWSFSALKSEAYDLFRSLFGKDSPFKKKKKRTRENVV